MQFFSTSKMAYSFLQPGPWLTLGLYLKLPEHP